MTLITLARILAGFTARFYDRSPNHVVIQPWTALLQQLMNEDKHIVYTLPMINPYAGYIEQLVGLVVLFVKLDSHACAVVLAGC